MFFDFIVVWYSLIDFDIDFENWAWYRPGMGRMTPDDIDPALCTHIMYGFATLDTSTLLLKAYDTWADIDNSKWFSFLERIVPNFFGIMKIPWIWIVE